jgi:peptidoglycan/LPS O-acetylase OafA/YrhL
MKTHIPYLDGWRGLAIVFLLIGHFFPISGINFGAIGVALFFVLSGFLMSKILFIDKVPLPIFYRRRISRILLPAATFTNNYFVVTGNWTMPVGHIWSLSVEEHAYVVLSLLALSCRARKTSGLGELGVIAGTAAAIAAAYWFAFGRNPPPGLWLHTEVAAFGIMMSGFLLLAFRKHRFALPAFAVPLLVVLGISAYWWRVVPPATLVIGCSAFALALNLLDRSPGLFRTLLECRLLRQFGVWSYSLYLWQQPFYMLAKREGLPAPLGLACTLAVGIGAFYLVENPARLWLNRVLTARIVIEPREDDVPILPP